MKLFSQTTTFSFYFFCNLKFLLTKKRNLDHITAFFFEEKERSLKTNFHRGLNVNIILCIVRKNKQCC
jgi:hypothetical protein